VVTDSSGIDSSIPPVLRTHKLVFHRVLRRRAIPTSSRMGVRASHELFTWTERPRERTALAVTSTSIVTSVPPILVPRSKELTTGVKTGVDVEWQSVLSLP
jgi:hypothetical protein